MTPAQIRALRDELQDTQTDFARRLGLSHRGNVARLESGGRAPTGPLLAALTYLAALVEHRHKPPEVPAQAEAAE